MKTFPKNKARTSLLKKGFHKENKSSHHCFYYLYIGDKKTRIYTYLSHSSDKEINSKVLGKMKKQLRFNTRENFDNFLDCPFNGNDYLKMLKDNKEI